MTKICLRLNEIHACFGPIPLWIPQLRALTVLGEFCCPIVAGTATGSLPHPPLYHDTYLSSHPPSFNPYPILLSFQRLSPQPPPPVAPLPTTAYPTVYIRRSPHYTFSFFASSMRHSAQAGSPHPGPFPTSGLF